MNDKQTSNKLNPNIMKSITQTLSSSFKIKGQTNTLNGLEFENKQTGQIVNLSYELRFGMISGGNDVYCRVALYSNDIRLATDDLTLTEEVNEFRKWFSNQVQESDQLERDHGRLERTAFQELRK